MPVSTIVITSSAPGNFTVAHGLGAVPNRAFISMMSDGEIYWQSPRFDGTNLYLTASDAGLVANIDIFYEVTNSSSTITVQSLIDYARGFPGTTPILGLAGYSDEPALSFANDLMAKIFAKSNPWKFNAAKLPVFYTNPYQQDYPTSLSQNVLGWLQAAVIIDVNNTSRPRPLIPITCNLALMPTMMCNRPSKIAWVTNSVAITGSWPGPNQAYVHPLVSKGGGPSSNPLAAITDPNGNIQVVATYGVTGDGPTWPAANAPVGTVTQDGTVQWVSVDPNGVAIRLDAISTNNSVVWEIRALYQKKAPPITALGQTFFPIPDDLGYLIKQGFLMFCRKTDMKAPPNAFLSEMAQFEKEIQSALGSSDRELNEMGFYPAQPLQSGWGDAGGAGSYSYPGWPGWS